MRFWIRKAVLPANLEMHRMDSVEYLFLRVTGLRRQVFRSLFGFNLLSKEDASL